MPSRHSDNETPSSSLPAGSGSEGYDALGNTDDQLNSPPLERSKRPGRGSRMNDAIATLRPNRNNGNRNSGYVFIRYPICVFIINFYCSYFGELQ
jgi:hypothetical protein